MTITQRKNTKYPTRQALLLWGFFIALNILLNGTIPFVLGKDVSAWTASTNENLFYYGFLAERLSHTFGSWETPLLIGLMYGFHEITVPEYWYEGVFFPIIFIGVAIFALIYLWRRNVIAIWLGDGLGRFLSNLL